MTRDQQTFRRRKRGFEMASGLLQKDIRKVGESRGFSVSRLLTHWREIVGEQTAATAVPVNVSYSKGGFGATLTILTTGSQAPMLQADLPRLKDRVNACYGYAAISRIKITQTAASGFADGKVAFEHAKATAPKAIDRETSAAAHSVAGGVGDGDLRSALTRLGENILTKTREKRGN